MLIRGVPLLIFAFAIYNIIAFLMPGFSWMGEVLRFRMVSGGEWGLSGGDIIVAGSIVVLLFELIRSSRMNPRTIVEHILAMILFIAMLVEFLMVPETATATFFLLLVISFVDVVGGFSIGMRAAQRNVSLEGVENINTR